VFYAFALATATAVAATPPPPRIIMVARARVISGARISLRDPLRKPPAATIRKGLIEFP
jgi:hypothetical protein